MERISLLREEDDEEEEEEEERNLGFGARGSSTEEEEEEEGDGGFEGLKNSMEVDYDYFSSYRVNSQKRLKQFTPQFVSSGFESLDYDPVHNKVHRQSSKTNTTTTYEQEARMRWVISVVIGLCVALVAFGVGQGVYFLQKWRTEITSLAEKSCHDCLWLPLLCFTLISCFYSLIAAIFVAYVEPLAGGSGIPEVKCYLNGLKIPKVTRLKTLAAKAVGITFAVGAGLIVGKEGSMLHSGAIVAAGVSQGASVSAGVDSGLLKRFRSDPVKRDFVTGGVAAGVAAGFGAPIGGVMFTLEEGASHWNQALTWRTFFSASICMFFLNFLLSCRSSDTSNPCVGEGCGFFSQPGLITFGNFGNTSGWTIVHLPFFLILGAMCGTLGAGFVTLNKKISVLRRRYLSKPIVRVFETLVLTIITCMVRYLIPYFMFSCRCTSSTTTESTILLSGKCGILGVTPSHHLTSHEVSGDDPLDLPTCGDYIPACTCTEDPPNCYADSMVVMFSSSETAIRALFHWAPGFSLYTLVVAFVCFWFLGCISQGAAVPSGIFIPALLIGAVFGRMFGEVLELIFPSDDPTALVYFDAGIFALIGAVSFLAGIARTTISLTVMMMEATNDITYGLPIMMTVMVSKWFGDMLSEGMFDLYIQLNKIPFLGWEPPSYMAKLTARQIMAAPVVQFREVEQVGTVYDVLKNTKHNGFPVVNDHGKFVGLMLRSQLITCLRKRAFSVTRTHVKNYYSLVGMDDFLQDYPRVTPFEDIFITEEEKVKYMDLSPYMQLSPYSVHPITLLARVFTLFRTMGLRHLTVVDENNEPVGIITRKNLVYLEESSLSLHATGHDGDFIPDYSTSRLSAPLVPLHSSTFFDN